MSSTNGTPREKAGEQGERSDGQSGRHGGTTPATHLHTYLHARRWTASITAVTVALSAMQWAQSLTSGGPWYGVPLQIALIAATVLFAVAPMPATFLIVTLHSCVVLLGLGGTTVVYDAWSIYMAVGYLAYAARPWATVAVSGYLGLLATTLIRMATPDMPLTTMASLWVSLCSGYVVAAIVGWSVRQQRQMDLLRRQLMRERYAERNLDAALRLHDQTSTELTSIALTAQLGLRTASAEEHRDQFDRIARQTNEALAHVHRIILLLNNRMEMPEPAEGTTAGTVAEDMTEAANGSGRDGRG